MIDIIETEIYQDYEFEYFVENDNIFFGNYGINIKQQNINIFSRLFYFEKDHELHLKNFGRKFVDSDIYRLSCFTGKSNWQIADLWYIENAKIYMSFSKDIEKDLYKIFTIINKNRKKILENCYIHNFNKYNINILDIIEKSREKNILVDSIVLEQKEYTYFSRYKHKIWVPSQYSPWCKINFVDMKKIDIDKINFFFSQYELDLCIEEKSIYAINPNQNKYFFELYMKLIDIY